LFDVLRDEGQNDFFKSFCDGREKRDGSVTGVFVYVFLLFWDGDDVGCFPDNRNDVRVE